ncbi:TPA: hypothetical protein DDW35_11555 [Candidatus Sumerlaeota bacterium]|nr:hypothetical protein [Candidatus Sumerlaeota bacterium]
MNVLVHFHTANLQSLFQVIGSADRELLQDIGVTFGSEYRSADEEEEVEDSFGEDEDEKGPDWELDEAEADAGREIVTKMVMVGLPHDMSEDEAYAVQDFMAAYALRSDEVAPFEAEEVLDGTLPEEIAEELEDDCRRLLTRGASIDEFGDLFEWLVEREASTELTTRIQMLYLGRLPESDESTFTDLEEETYSARFGYLFGEEAATIVDELDELLENTEDEPMPLAYALSCLFNYCNVQNTDLLVTIEE